MATELTIVVPTYNELDNVEKLVVALDQALAEIAWEVIFVDDDSSDGTASRVRQLAQTNSRVRCLQRINRRGLASACIEGILASASPYVAVMDADLQHDERVLPKMLNTLRNDCVDLVIATRYLKGGSTGDLPSHRVWISSLATQLSLLVLKRPISDPMSGFFMLTRAFFERIMRKLSGRGFKILFDILTSGGSDFIFREQTYAMRTRSHGKSKLGAIVIWDFFVMIAHKSVHRLVPAEFISFITVGLSGIFVHLTVLGTLHHFYHYDFSIAQIAATVVAMTSNYVLNNMLTFRERKLIGVAFFKGLFSFYLTCSLGAMINVAVAVMLFDKGLPWWVAGTLGTMAGSVWNYAISTKLTWQDRKSE